jgi:cytochrome bd-type quinol oxidase subunit 2
MNTRKPPGLAIWLLERVSTGYRGESLAGDLIEQYALGKSRLWLWRQVAAAIVLAKRRSLEPRLLRIMKKVAFRLLTEISIVLALVMIIDQTRRSHSLSDMLSPTFSATIAFPIAAALVGFVLSRRSSRSRRQPAVFNYLIALFALAALGAGTLTWASTTRPTCNVDRCSCPTPERSLASHAAHLVLE